MNPSREYKRTESEYDDETAFSVRETESKNSYEDELGVLKMDKGRWDVFNPKTREEFWPKDKDGNNVLFKAYPSVIETLHGTDNVTPKSIQHVLALAHQEAKKHGPGTLTYSPSLSDHSSPLVLHALDQGYLEENPYHPREKLQAEADKRAAKRAEYHTLDEDAKRIANLKKLEMRHSGSSSARENYDEIIENRGSVEDWGEYEDDNGSLVEESWTTDPTWKEVETLPSTAGQDAVNAVKSVRDRKRAQQELPEPPQAPVEHEGNLWDHASKTDRKSWNAASKLPTATRAGAFKDYVGNVVSKIKGN
jgi:hypothetical protein